MKNTKFLISFIIIIIVTSVSCKKLVSLLDVTFATSYSVELDAIIPPTTSIKHSEGDFSVLATIDPKNNPEFLKYSEKIKEIEITSISAKVLSISKPLTINSASISVFSETKIASWTFTNELITVGKILTLGNVSNQWVGVQNILSDKKVFTVHASGQTDVGNATFTIEVTINAIITANPLGN